MDRMSYEERRRIAELLAEGAPVWRLHREIGRSRHAILRAVIALQRPARREPKRSPLRLSLAEREEISRGKRRAGPCGGSSAGWSRAPTTVPGGGGQRRSGPVPACAADRRARPWEVRYPWGVFGRSVTSRSAQSGSAQRKPQAGGHADAHLPAY